MLNQLLLRFCRMKSVNLSFIDMEIIGQILTVIETIIYHNAS